MRKEYYRVAHSTEDYKAFDLGTAFTPDNWNRRLVKGKRGQSLVGVSLPELILNEGSYTDYQASDLGEVCSYRLMTIIEKNKSPVDTIEWFDVDIRSSMHGTRKYYFLHFPVIYDVLDNEHTVFIEEEPRSVVIPCLSYEKAKNHHIFAFPNSYVGFVVSKYLKDKIMDKDCIGLDFSPIQVI